MKFVHPVNDKAEYCSNNQFGFYPLGRMNAWHGGIHIEADKPVCAIADGTIIAFRITKNYLKETIDGSTYEYSNCFVLIQHQYKSPKGNELVFYSLYNHLKCFEAMKQSGEHPEIFLKTWYKANKDTKEMPDDSMDHDKIRDIKKGTILDVMPKDSGWGKVVRNAKDTSGYVWMDNYDEVKTWRLNDSNLDKIVNCNIPVKAGNVIGHTGIYAVEKLSYYRAVHVEVFAADNVEKFLNNSKNDGEKQKHYLKVKQGAKLKKAFPDKLHKDDCLLITETSDSYCRIKKIKLTRTVEKSQIINGAKCETTKGIKYRDYKYNPKVDDLQSLSQIFGIPLKQTDWLYLEEDSAAIAKGQETRKVSFDLIDNLCYWTPLSPFKKLKFHKGNIVLNFDITEIYEQQPLKGQPKEIIFTENVIYEIKNLKTHKDPEGKLWYFISHKNKKSETEEGWVREDDANLKMISPYDWAEFGFQIVTDSADDFIYDSKNPSQFLSKICNEIDTDSNGVLSQLELQRALRDYPTAYKLSHLVVKHTNEWAYDDAKISKLKSLLDKNFTKEIEKEDTDKKKAYTDLKNQRLEAIQERCKNLTFWQQVKTSKNSFTLEVLKGIVLATSVFPGMYVNYKFGKWLFADNESEKEKPETEMVPFPSGSPQVYHFHPTAFVEQMRKILKRDIDLRDLEKWQSQFDSKFGEKSKQNIACWRACKTILNNHNIDGGELVNGVALYQIAIELNYKLVIDQEIAEKAIEYIDEQIEQGKPVIVGVDHTYKYKGGFNNDLTTDHFIVIVGRIYDGNYYYLFYEVGTSYIKHGVSDNNRLYLQSDYALKGATSYTSEHSYTVTQIRKNN